MMLVKTGGDFVPIKSFLFLVSGTYLVLEERVAFFALYSVCN